VKLYFQKLKWQTDTDVWVCFNCRVQVRESWVNTAMCCPKYGYECSYLGDEVSISPESHLLEWLAMHQEFLRQRRDLFADLTEVRPLGCA
jgi:hypothetical protein